MCAGDHAAMKFSVVLSTNARRHIRYMIRQGLMSHGEHQRVTRMPLFVVQEATPELLEAWAEEMDVAGDMLLDDYVKTNGLIMDSDAYRKEFPEDALYTFLLEDTTD